MAHQSVHRGRRALLRGRLDDAAHVPRRPPWAAAGFEEACTRCGACLEACPQAILMSGDGGFPEVDFARGAGECTFCAACAEACPEPAFDRTRAPPWRLVAAIGEACLAFDGVHCQSCGDACAWGAIRFTLRIGAPPQPSLDPEACTGCGACLGVCPAEAITTAVQPQAEEVTAHV